MQDAVLRIARRYINAMQTNDLKSELLDLWLKWLAVALQALQQDIEDETHYKAPHSLTLQAAGHAINQAWAALNVFRPLYEAKGQWYANVANEMVADLNKLTSIHNFWFALRDEALSPQKKEKLETLIEAVENVWSDGAGQIREKILHLLRKKPAKEKPTKGTKPGKAFNPKDPHVLKIINDTIGELAWRFPSEDDFSISDLQEHNRAFAELVAKLKKSDPEGLDSLKEFLPGHVSKMLRQMDMEDQ